MWYDHQNSDQVLEGGEKDVLLTEECAATTIPLTCSYPTYRDPSFWQPLPPHPSQTSFHPVFHLMSP